MQLTIEYLIGVIYNFAFAFFIGLIGAFARDLSSTIMGKEKINVARIFLGALFSAFAYIGFAEIALKWISMNTLIFVQFILGILGFELLNRFSTIKDAINTYLAIRKLKKEAPEKLLEELEELKEAIKKDGQ